jgi:hypothetical protein
MMRSIIITILTILISNCYAQTGRGRVFKRTEYTNGIVYRQTIVGVNVENTPVDIYFLSKYFYSPYYLPEKFTDERYIGQIISSWSEPDSEENFQRNQKYTCTYDSIGRVINYTYSSCILCSNMPYNYSVTYNSKGQVALIVNGAGISRFKFSYNKKGDIIKFEKYSLDDLETEIALVR